MYANGEFKSYTDGKSITDKYSAAYWQLQRMSVVNGLYMEGEYVGIAISSFYGRVGDKFRITLSSGQVFYAVMTDTKQSSQLDENYTHPDGSLIEFIVDTPTLPEQVRLEGSLNCIYTGSIEKIERME